MYECCGNCKWCYCKETGWYDDSYHICENKSSEYFQVKVKYKDVCEKYEERKI